MTMGLAALEEIVIGPAAAVCWSQQPQSPHLEPVEPRQLGEGGAAWPDLDCMLQGPRSPDRSTVAAMSPACSPTLLVTRICPLLSIIFAQNQVLLNPQFVLIYFQLLLFFWGLGDPTHPSPPKTAVLKFNHYWMRVEVGGRRKPHLTSCIYLSRVARERHGEWSWG